MEECMGIICEQLQTDDEDIQSYLESVLENGFHDFTSSSDVYDAVGEVIESSADCDVTTVEALCETIYNILSISSKGNNGTMRKLDAPIHIRNNEENYEQNAQSSNAASIWIAKQDKKTLVDMKKLGKAEAKIKQKQEKKANIAPQRDDVVSTSEASASQSVNRKDMKSELMGKNRTSDIHIENFDVSFGSKVLFEGCNLHIACGRRYGFVGRNGMGKTTLLKMLSTRNLSIPSHISVLHVEQEVEGNETTALESVLESDVTRKSLIDEEIFIQTQLNQHEQVSSSLGQRLTEIYAKLSDIEADKAPARAAVVLNGLGFTNDMQKMMTKEFSGGWRMRLSLARALFSKPDLLLLDEPTNMLDLRAILWIEDYLQDWPTTLIVVSHDRNFLTSVCTDILHLNSRQIDSYRGSFEQFLVTKEEKFKNRIKEYEAQKQYRDHIQIFIDRFRYNANRASQVQSKLKLLDKLPKLVPIAREKQSVIRFPSDHSPLGGTALQLDEVQFNYVEGKIVFKNVDISAGFDSRICIVGENGSGKTTLLKMLCGVLEPVKGVRHVHRGLRIGYFTQHHVDQLDLDVTCIELLANKFPGRSQEDYRHQLGSFGVTGELALQPVASLSGGQKSRLAFSMLSMPRPNFLILDEPTNHLDMETIDALAVAINQFDGGIVLVSHNERLIRSVCQEVWLCGGQQIKSIEGGFETYKKLLEDEFVRLGIQ